jgi:hypothetical protein
VAAGAPSSPLSPPLVDPQIAAILTQIDALEASLHLDIVVHPNDKQQIAALARVSDAALSMAANVVAGMPSLGPQFGELPGASEYVQKMAPLVQRVTDFAAHLQKDIRNRRTPAALEALTLYAFLKSLARLPENETIREKVATLQAELAPKRKNPKPRVTKAQKVARSAAKRQAAKVAKAKELLASVAPVAPNTPAAAPSPPTSH